MKQLVEPHHNVLCIFELFAGVTCTKSVTVYIGNREFHFLRGLEVAINGNNVSVADYNENGVSITRAGLFHHLVAATKGFEVMWDGGT